MEAVLLRELPLTVDRIGADPEAAGADRGELRLEIAEVAALLGAPRRHRPGVEEQDDRPSPQLVGEADGMAVLGRQLKVGDSLTGAHTVVSKHRTPEKRPNGSGTPNCPPRLRRGAPRPGRAFGVSGAPSR